MATGIIKGSTVVGIKEEATAATATIQVINDTFDGAETITVNGVVFTEGVDFITGSGINTTASNISAAINASDNKLVNGVLTASVVTDTVTLTADLAGTDGNSLTLAEGNTGGTDNLTLSGAVFTGGAFTEGTASAPASASDFVQVLEDGLEISPAKELVERNILTSSIGKVSPRVSIKSATGALPIEFRGQGSEGGTPQYDVPLRSLLGARRKLRNRITTGASHTTSQINVASASDIFSVGDFIVILEAGAHHSAFVTAVNSGDIQYAPAPTAGAPSDSVEIAKTVTYYPANDNHPSFTKSVYWADEIREQTIGTRCASMSVDSFSTGQISNLNFSTEALSFDEVDGSAPFTPSFDSGLPPLVLNVSVFQGTTCLDINEFTLSIENTISSLTSVKSADGRISSRVSARTISGSFNPFKDDADVSQFTKFNENTLYSMIITGQNDSAVSGEFDLGSCFGIYLPNCLSVEKIVGDTDGVLIENISFSANRGEDGTSEEIFIGYC
jgi:hypothetical protein